MKMEEDASYIYDNDFEELKLFTYTISMFISNDLEQNEHTVQK